MVKITKVYTRKGDSGQTRISGRHCMAKNNPRMIVIGELDELNSHLGFSIIAMKTHASLKVLVEKILRRQHELFNLGAQLAVLPKDRKINTPCLKKAHIVQLENEIDEMNKTLPILHSFILPGGCEASARLHLARSICRRAERSLVFLSSEDSTLDGAELPYLNRLSDWLFVASRTITHQLNFEEILWNPKEIG